MFCQNESRPGAGRWLLPVTRAFCLFLVTAQAISTAAAAQLMERLKLTASDAAEGDTFGASVAVSGNTALVGAVFDDPAGSTYVFDVTTGQELFKLVPSDQPIPSNAFGESVAISGNTVIVGAPTDNDAGAKSGAAYVFDATTGQQLFKLTASDPAERNFFGGKVGISGSAAIVGSAFDDAAGRNSGSAYLFDVRTGQELMKLTASDAAGGDNFGRSVAISGDVAIVGAYRDDHAGEQSGSAYIFDVTSGQELFKLTASDAAMRDKFGISVAISGNIALVGAVGNGSAGTGSGAAYLFDVTTGQELFRLQASDAKTRCFGCFVAIDGRTALVGAPSAKQLTGSAFVFDVTTGEEIFQLAASDSSFSLIHKFGWSVGISGAAAIVGAIGDDGAGRGSGAAYLFDVPEPPSVVLGALGLMGVLAYAAGRRRL